jgi:hypothetical protein
MFNADYKKRRLWDTTQAGPDGMMHTKKKEDIHAEAD